MVVATQTSRNKSTSIGIDIGTGGMRAVQLARTAATYDVAAMALRTFPRTGQDAATPASETIRALLRQGSFRGKRVIAALDSPALAYHALELPAALVADPDRDVAEVVRLEVDRLAEGPTDAVHTSYWRLPPTQVPAPNTIGVALRREAVLETLDTCASAGLVCVCVDSAATALCRFGALLRRWQPEEVWGLLDLGGGETRLILCLDDVPVLVRGAGSGGAVWTERIRDGLQVSSGAAEVHKCEHGIALTSRGVRPGSDATPTQEIASILLGALRSELRDLAGEIKRSYEYVLSCYPGRRPADLVLVGGGSGMHNLPEFLNQALGIQVRCASEYLAGDDCRLRYASGKQHRLETVALAVGLAVEQ